MAANFSREASAESPLASARGLLNGQPVQQQPVMQGSFLSRLRCAEPLELSFTLFCGAAWMP